MDPELSALLVGRNQMVLSVEDGMELRLLSAYEILEVGREAAQLVQGDREKALCSNACLLAKAVIRNGVPVFADGQEVLKRLRVEEIAALSKRWDQFNKEENPSTQDGEDRIDALKKA